MVNKRGLIFTVTIVTFLIVMGIAATGFSQQQIPPDVKAVLSAKPASYTGNCPALITFGGYIAVNQPMTVQYKFIRSDNAEAPVQTLYFSSKSRQEVTTTWQLGGPGLPTYSGWEAIQIISPVSVQSNRAAFRVRCAGLGQPGQEGGPGQQGQLSDLTIEDITLNEQCFVVVTAKNNGPGRVPDEVWTVHTPDSSAIYLHINGKKWGGETIWHLDRDKNLQNPGGTAIMTSNLKISGTAMINTTIDSTRQVREENERNNQMRKKLTCQPGAVMQPGRQVGPRQLAAQQGQQGIPIDVKARLSAKPASYTGSCPALITFGGYIAVNQPMTVQYKFIRSDNAEAPVQTLYFSSKSQQEVTTSWQLGGPGLPTYSGWEAIQIISPVSVESNKAEFNIRCAGQPGVVTRPGMVTKPAVVDRPDVVAQPSVGKEDCISFNPATTAVQQIQGSWKIVDGSHWMFDFGNNESEARRALAIIQKYRMNQSCFVGRPNPSFQYMLVSGNAPVGALGGEDCISFNPATTTVQQIQGSWKIVDGSHWMFDFGANKTEADQALAIIKKYGFTHSCFVGRPGPSFKYLRR